MADRSLFERLTQTGHPSVLLDTQYRMTPAISAFPNETFYQGRLRNGQNVHETSYGPPFLADPQGDSAADILGRSSGSSLPVNLLKFMVLDLQSSLDSGSGSSQSNHPAPAIPPVKSSSQISTAQSNLPSQTSSTAVVASVSASQPSTSLTNSEEALLCVRLVETLIIQARARTKTKTSNTPQPPHTLQFLPDSQLNPSHLCLPSHHQARASGCATIGSIGIITFYADQVGEIKRKLQLSGLLTASGTAGAAAGAGRNSSSGSSSSSSGSSSNSTNANASVSISATNYVPGADAATGGNVSLPVPQGKGGASRDPATTLDIEVTPIPILSLKTN